MLDFIAEKYGWGKENIVLSTLGNGLINATWKLEIPGHAFVLQKINSHVFTDPYAIDGNLNMLSAYLVEHHPDYRLIAPIRSVDGTTLVVTEEGEFFRVLPFVAGSHSKDVVETADEAYEAAKMFGQFTAVLSGMNANRLQRTIPHFHDLELRFTQFNQAVKTGNIKRIAQAEKEINFLRSGEDIVVQYKNILSSPAFRLRVTHHDTKISNVLFDDEGKGMSVIDLDTVMPGYFISDVGDMMRTYLSPVGEEEADLSLVEVRDDFYQAIVNGYMEQMRQDLSEEERSCFFYAGTYMIYMQALRFLTDHLQDDVYYGAKYPGHNLVRAANQSCLLQKLLEKKQQFTASRSTLSLI